MSSSAPITAHRHPQLRGDQPLAPAEGDAGLVIAPATAGHQPVLGVVVPGIITVMRQQDMDNVRDIIMS